MITIKLVTFVIGTLIIFSDIKKYIRNENRNISIYAQSAFFFFYYIPVLCDMFQRPVYTNIYQGFIISYEDFGTELIYCLVITYINYMFHYFQKKNVYTINFNSININTKLISFIIFSIIFSIIMYILAVMDNEIFNAVFTYNMRNLRTTDANSLKTLAFAIIALVLVFIAIEEKKEKIRIKIFFMIPFLIFACLINGKRASIFICVIGILMILIFKNVIKSKVGLFITVLICGLILFLYANSYAKNITQELDSYLSYRINYCRDDTLKMTIYSELNGNKILEHRGQTLLYYLTFFVSRSIWNNKPYPYATYFTSALLNLDKVENLGWNMTTSIYDEILSNLGWIGILIVPFIMNRLLNNIAKRNNGILGKIILFLGIFGIVLLLAVQASAFLYLYILLIILIIIYDLKERFKLEKKRKGECINE